MLCYETSKMSTRRAASQWGLYSHSPGESVMLCRLSGVDFGSWSHFNFKSASMFF